MMIPEQEEIFQDIVDSAVEVEIDNLSQKETLDTIEREKLAALQAHLNPVPITKAQCIHIQATANITIENEINNLLQKKTLDTFEQEMLSYLRLYQRAELEQLEPKYQFKLGVSIVINSIEKAIEFVRTKIGNRSVDDVDEHPLNQTATEILRHLWIVDNEIETVEEQIAISDGEKDDQILTLTEMPIIQLLEWSATAKQDQKLAALNVMALEGKHNEILTLLAGENSPVGDHWMLGQVGVQETEGIKTALRNSLNWILEEAEV